MYLTFKIIIFFFSFFIDLLFILLDIHMFIR